MHNLKSVSDLPTLHNSIDTDFEITPNSLFERHCAIVGTTGGGKSYTISQLLQQIIDTNVNHGTKQKAILIDATGEFHKYAGHEKVQAVCFGNSVKYSGKATQVFFHYSKLRSSDLIALLRPGGQVQRPKLMEAIKSLKLTTLIAKQTSEYLTAHPFLSQCDLRDGGLIKALREKAGFKRSYSHFVQEIEADNSEFEIRSLSTQIRAECVFDSDGDPLKWGKYNPTDVNHVSSLVARIEQIIHDPSFGAVFGFDKGLEYPPNTEFYTTLKEFLEGDKSVFLISLEQVSFDFGLREILVNAIGRLLLEKARNRDFLQNPLILMLDEAHQFLKKSIKDEYFAEVELDSFDKIAKECRKHGLYLCISTQMPRDIPDGTLSQMGTFIVHRLINEKDREKIQSACSEANKQSLSYLPILGEGVALLISVGLPMPVMIQVKKPHRTPDSKAPILFKLPA